MSAEPIIDFHAYPDAAGHFGRYGGRFVAETLIGPLEELAAAYDAARVDPAFIAEFEDDLAHYVGRPEPDLPRRAAEPRSRRRAHPAQARGPEPHRRAQDQQHHRPGAARQPHGQDPHHRRDRRRPARRRQRHRRRAAGPGMRGLHGRDRHRAPEDQRLPHEAARRDGGAGDQRLGDAQGRAQRGDARLGDQRARHVLHHRHRGRPRSVSAHGARLQRRGRSRGARADAGRIRPPARCGDRLRRRRQQRDRHLPRVPQRPRRAHRRRRGGGRGHRHRPPRRLAGRRPARRAARQPHLRAVRRRRPDHRDAFGFGRPRLSRASVPSTPSSRTPAAPSTSA